MSTRLALYTAIWIAAVGLPDEAGAQEEALRSPAERASQFEEWIRADSVNYTLRWQAAREYSRAILLEPQEEERRRLGYRAREHARAATGLEPQGIEGHYRLAVASGQLTDLVGGRTKIRMAKESWDESGWVLAADSGHAGAHFIRGRINAGVQRTSPILRFLARVVLGADAIAGTSWEAAIRHFETAAALEPQTPMHHFELARAYRDRKRTDAMKRSLEAALAAAGSGNEEADEEYRRQARAELAEGGP